MEDGNLSNRSLGREGERESQGSAGTPVFFPFHTESHHSSLLQKVKRIPGRHTHTETEREREGEANVEPCQSDMAVKIQLFIFSVLSIYQ